jgi:hypothetical protein
VLPQTLLQACTERIKKDTTGEAHCTGQYFDYWGCIDKCVRALALLCGSRVHLACYTLGGSDINR